jgi:murein DD-endopeptidase MepM/ murein hydrolase activator NlpD
VSISNKQNGTGQQVSSVSGREKLLANILWAFAGAMVILAVVLGIILKPSFGFADNTPPTSVPTVAPTQPATSGSPVQEVDFAAQKKVVRALNPHTVIDSSIRKDAEEYTVGEGDSLFQISKKFDLKAETIFWANYDELGGSPDMIAPGITLVIPPSDGVYYKFKEGDTLQSVADQFYAKLDDILQSSVNKLDLTNPVVKADTYIMVPGGKREAVEWFQGAIPRGSAGTLAKLFGEGGCDTSAGGAIGDGSFGNPMIGGALIGNDYIEGVHQGVDLGSPTSGAIVAADDGVVVYSGWANGGYGITVMIDHGNGFQTLYAHMSYTSVSCGASVGQGTQIGVVGSTGNSTGPHLHFEIRYMGLNDNPHNYF